MLPADRCGGQAPPRRWFARALLQNFAATSSLRPWPRRIVKDLTMSDPIHPPAITPPPEHIAVRSATLGEGFTVGRALPTRQRRMVGAWCFLDHLGPVTFTADQGMHVGAHPHTCLQTFTWMIAGQVLHRDSLGSEQIIRPGEVNLMTAGRGIVHTEDSLPGTTVLHAAQLWIALPAAHAFDAPSFEHHATLPAWQQDGITCTLLAGDYGLHHAPAQVHTPLLGMDLHATTVANLSGSATTRLTLDPSFEYGVLVLAGTANIAGEPFTIDEFAYLGQGHDTLAITLAAGSRALLLGGAPFGSPVVMWWNFVGHDRATIVQAQADWESGAPRFGRVTGDDDRRLTAPQLPWA